MEHWDYLEKLLSELYRKEIDNEENIWRSLPFFSATLAIEVAVVIQLLPLILDLLHSPTWAIIASIAMVTLLTTVLAVIVLLYRAIRSAKFSYIASEPDLIDYVIDLEARSPGKGQTADGPSVKTELQRLLIRQYADATANNRGINHRRARARGRAGTLLLASIIATLVLVAAIIGPQLIGRVTAEIEHERGDSAQPGGPGSASPGPQTRTEPRSGPGSAATDASRDKGLVDVPRGEGADGGSSAEAP